ncbi:MAG: hypothetical protein OCC45_03975 [Desulfotalea sp.]
MKILEGEMYVVKKGLEHKPYDEDECSLLIESRGVVNIGESASDLEAENDVWLHTNYPIN